jgi:hypothetical protein
MRVFPQVVAGAQMPVLDPELADLGSLWGHGTSDLLGPGIWGAGPGPAMSLHAPDMKRVHPLSPVAPTLSRTLSVSLSTRFQIGRRTGETAGSAAAGPSATGSGWAMRTAVCDRCATVFETVVKGLGPTLASWHRPTSSLRAGSRPSRCTLPTRLCSFRRPPPSCCASCSRPPTNRWATETMLGATTTAR